MAVENGGEGSRQQQADGRTTAGPPRGRPVPRPRRVAMLVAIAVASAGPYFLLAYGSGRPWVSGAAALVVVVAAVEIRGVVSHRQDRPGIAELALFMLGSTYYAALGALSAVLLYGAVAGLFALLRAVGVGFLSSGAAFVTTVPLAATVVLGMASVLLEEIGSQLYPPFAGASLPYAQLLSTRRRQLRLGVALSASAGLAVIGLFGVWLNWTGLGLAVVLLVYAVAITLPLAPSSDGAEVSGDVVSALVQALQSEGYEVVTDPRTGDPDIDPLLDRVTAFAYQSVSSLTVTVLGAGADPTGDWTAALSTVGAARALEKSPHLPEGVTSVRPVLVLMDREPDPTLTALAQGEGFPLVVVRTPDGSVAVRDSDEEEGSRLGDLARQALTALAPPPAGDTKDTGRW